MKKQTTKELDHPILNREHESRSGWLLTDLRAAATGDEEVCLRLNIVVEIPMDDIVEAERRFSDAIELFREYGATAITKLEVVPKEW